MVVVQGGLSAAHRPKQPACLRHTSEDGLAQLFTASFRCVDCECGATPQALPFRAGGPSVFNRRSATAPEIVTIAGHGQSLTLRNPLSRRAAQPRNQTHKPRHAYAARQIANRPETAKYARQLAAPPPFPGTPNRKTPQNGKIRSLSCRATPVRRHPKSEIRSKRHNRVSILPRYPHFQTLVPRQKPKLALNGKIRPLSCRARRAPCATKVLEERLRAYKHQNSQEQQIFANAEIEGLNQLRVRTFLITN